jgi:DNA repair exonuclease SbcCD ATPase subunit
MCYQTDSMIAHKLTKRKLTNTQYSLLLFFDHNNKMTSSYSRLKDKCETLRCELGEKDTFLKRKDDKIQVLKKELALAKRDVKKCKRSVTNARETKLRWTKKLGSKCRNLQQKLKNRERRLEKMKIDVDSKLGELRRTTTKLRATNKRFNARNKLLEQKLEELSCSSENKGGTGVEITKTRKELEENKKLIMVCDELVKKAAESEAAYELLIEKQRELDAEKQRADQKDMELSSVHGRLLETKNLLQRYIVSRQKYKRLAQESKEELSKAYKNLAKRDKQLTEIYMAIAENSDDPQKLLQAMDSIDEDEDANDVDTNKIKEPHTMMEL